MSGQQPREPKVIIEGNWPKQDTYFKRVYMSVGRQQGKTDDFTASPTTSLLQRALLWRRVAGHHL